MGRLSWLAASLVALGCSSGATYTPDGGADGDLATADVDLATAGGGGGGGSGGGLDLGAGDLAPSPWKLTWSDEFNGPAGAIDGSKWGFDVGTGTNGWGNNELEYYTNRTSNVVLDGNGALQIIARKEAFMGSGYTSGRITTSGKFSQAYGRFEARIQIAQGKGIWPAFWTLGDNIGTAGWPGCGELDIQETVGATPSLNHGSAHGPGYSGGNPLTATYQLPAGALSDGYHVYAIEWEPNQVRWYVDDKLYETRTPADVPAGTKWVYDHPFFDILNLAIGGNFPGPPDATTVFPQTTKVDYVRVYTKI
jgi:beta-glucanase (GH16 family)